AAAPIVNREFGDEHRQAVAAVKRRDAAFKLAGGAGRVCGGADVVPVERDGIDLQAVGVGLRHETGEPLLSARGTAGVGNRGRNQLDAGAVGAVVGDGGIGNGRPVGNRVADGEIRLVAAFRFVVSEDVLRI